MANTIILHGTCSRKDYYDGNVPSLSNQHWIPWLQKQLQIRDIKSHAPDMPLAFKPDYEIWEREVERHEINPETYLIGHSTGGGFWVRYLSENPSVKAGKVALVAPWLDPNNIKKTTFFDFEIDPDLVSRTQSVTIFNSIDDHQGILWSVEMLRQTIHGIKYREFDDRKHFMDMTEFPELLDELIE